MADVLERRARGVWLVLGISGVIFVALCSVGALGLSSVLTTLTVPHNATLEPRSNSPLVVQRQGFAVPESVERTTELQEGDEVRTGPAGGALLTLFDGSTVQLYFDTVVRIDRQRTSRFFSTTRENVLTLKQGTILLSTGSLGDFSEAKYTIKVEGLAAVSPTVNSRIRARVEGTGAQRMVRVTVDDGSARFNAQGREIALAPKTLGRADAGGFFEGPLPAEEELIRNGNLTEPPTSGAELTENGGLGTAAWVPIRTQVEPPVSNPGIVEVVTEEIGLQSLNAARFERDAADSRYTLVGMRQDINMPAEFLSVLELDVTAKVVAQTIPAPGPRGDLFPLTVRVIYRDGDGRSHVWKHAFFYLAESAEFPNATQVQLGAWTTAQRLPLKTADGVIGQDIQVIEAIEVYGFGTGFESWVTGLSLLAR